LSSPAFSEQFSLLPVALYCPWRGQLSIRGQLLCNIALRTPYSSTIPAQLPPNLDVYHVMGLSDLKKKLPEAAFGKKNYIENEVCFQGVYFSLYEVEISNKDQYKMDRLVENLKEKDLVSILKHCRDREDGDDSDISLKTASVLPGLRYALQKASSSRGDAVSTSIRVKQHFQEYAKLDQNTQPTSGQSSEVPLSSVFSPTDDECANPFKKNSEQSFSQLQCYLSNPSSYTLEMSAALGCLAGAVQSLCCDSEADCKVDFSSAAPPDPVPPNTARKVRSENPEPTVGLDQSNEGPTKDINSASKLWVGKNRKATKKKKINISFSFPKKPGLKASSNEPMLKLANLQFPHRRKRGAEVLSAEFVQKTQSEPVLKETSAPDDPSLEKKRPKTLKTPVMKKVPVTETITKPLKCKMQKSVANNPSKPQAKKQAESGKSAVSCGNLSFKSGVADLGFDLKENDYKSHALNLLADLALGSCIPSFIPRDSRVIAASCSSSSNSAKEQQSHHKHKSLRVASDHEYHRVDKLAKGATSTSKASPNQKLPPDEKTDLNDLVSISREKNPGIFSKKNSVSPSPAKTCALSPTETQEAAEVNKHCFISAEHSYASQMPEHSKKHMYHRGAPYPGLVPFRNGTRNPQSGLLMGKVLPFRHQQNSTHLQRAFQALAMGRRSSLLSPRQKEDFTKSHTVNIRGKSMKVTCHWEAEYLFNLDSRYTNDALEKTVIRALHGPWDPDLPHDMEDVKLIFHMWMALFYSKPSKLLSNMRKVVQHSNPKKYVSIHSTGDFLELSDDGEDWFELETCPADSWSDPDQTPSSSLDRSTHCQGVFHPEESPADSQTDADGSPDAGHCMEVVDGSWATSEGPQRACDSMSLEASPKSAKPDGAGGEGRESQDPFRHPKKEEEEVEEGKKVKEDSEYESTVLRPVGIEFSEGGDADTEHERSEQKRVNFICLKHFGVPREGPVPSPTAVTSPRPGRSTPVLSDGTGTGPQGLPGEVAPSLATLQEPWEALAASGAETNSVGLASPADVGSPHDSELMLPLPSAPSLVCGVQPDSITGDLGPAGETLGDGLEQKDDDRAPSAEKQAPAGSKTGSTAHLESLCTQGLSLTLLPDSSSVFLMSLDEATDPEAAPEDREATASIQSPSQSGLGGSSCLSQRCGGDVCADLALLSTDESNPEGNKVLVEEQRSGPSANYPGVLDESLGEGDGRGFTFDSTALAGDSEAEESGDVCLGSDKTNTVMVANALQEPETSLHHLLESEPSSSVREGMSATKEPPRQQQRSANGLSSPACGGSAPASPPEQDPLPHGEDTDPPHHSLKQSKQGPVLCQHGKPRKQAAAAEVSVAAESPGSSLKPRYAEEVKKDTSPCRAEPAESSPVAVLVPGNPSSLPLSPPHNHKAGLHSIEPDSVLTVHPKTCSPSVNLALDGAPRSYCVGQLPPGTCSRCASPEEQAADGVGSYEKEPIMQEGSEGGSSSPLASPASFSAGELLVSLCKPQSVCNHGEAKASDAFADLHSAGMEVGEGEIPALPFPTWPLHTRRRLDGESLELSNAEDLSDVLPRAKQLPSKDRHMGLTSEDVFETFSSDSNQEYFGGTSRSLLTAGGSYSTRSRDAAGTRTNCDSSMSSVHVEGCSEDWGSLGCSWAEPGWPIGPRETSGGHIPLYVNIRDSQGVARVYQNFLVTKKCQERMGNSQPSKGHSHCAGQSHLLRSLVGTWRGFEEITQHTLDMECLRFHYKLKQILRNGKPPFSTSKSIFPQDFSPQVMSETLLVRETPDLLSLQSRSPLQVTILPSDPRPSGLSQHRRSSWRGDPCSPWQDTLCNERSRAQTTSRGRMAPFHLSQLKYKNKLKDLQGDIAVILDKYAELNRVMLSRADAGSRGAGPVPADGEAASERTRASLPGRMAAFEEMIAELCSTLRFRLHSVAEEACGPAGMFYLVETGKDPFFARVKTLLKTDGRVEIEPLSFCEAERLDADRLLVVIRNEDISSHIHNQVPCLLKLKHSPNVVFAGVDSPEDITGRTYQELFHTGGFVVSDNEVLETVTLGQLKEVVKVLEKLNRSGRWKWLLHYKESKKLREDISRVDTNAHKKHLILKSGQGADLIEVLHYHACDAGGSPKAEYVRCLLNLQVQHVSARFAVYLTEKPSISREVLESKGILVANVNTFLETMQKAAAPFRRSYW
uniref:Transcription activation suppressor family member 2 n=2 Tax=Strigidae TaxID=30459 RepID=A0A8D0EIJ6_STROC